MPVDCVPVDCGPEGWLTVGCSLFVVLGLLGAVVVQAASIKAVRALALVRLRARMAAGRESVEKGMRAFLPKFKKAFCSQKNSCQCL